MQVIEEDDWLLYVKQKNKRILRYRTKTAKRDDGFDRSTS
jgi:hypothetical protein